MPTYDFRCSKCGHEFAKRVSYEDKDKVCCAQCGDPKIKQIFSGINIGKTGGSTSGASSACASCKGGSCC